jgi:hypothetical protein
MQNERSGEIKRNYEDLKSERYAWDSHWQDVRDLVRISTTSFTYKDNSGERRTENIFDGTAPWALEQLAAGLNSNLTSPTDRWYNIGFHSNQPLTDEELLWCEQVADLIYSEYADPEVNLNPMLHECYMDLGGFGTTVLYQDYNWKKRHVYFKSFPLANCYVKENAAGRIDTLYRSVEMTKRQILQEFADNKDHIPVKIQDGKTHNEKKFNLVHAVYPRSDGKKGYSKGKKPYASCWIIEEFLDEPPLRESGYDSFPYHVPRWSKLAGEVYGRGPAMTCLPDIKMINAQSKLQIKSGQKIMDPPLVVPDDGFMMPIKTSPGSLVFKTPGTEPIETLPTATHAGVSITLEDMNQRRGAIVKAFYVDWILREKKKERQTALEVNDDRSEMLRQMSPMLGRTHVELLNPMLVRTYELMDAAGRIPPAPESMLHQRLKIYYISPAAKAQEGSKAGNIQMFMNDVAQYAAAHPEILDIIDVDQLAQELAKYRDLTRKVIRNPDQVAKIRADRAQQQQMQQMAAVGKDLGAATKNFAQAREIAVPQ